MYPEFLPRDLGQIFLLVLMTDHTEPAFTIRPQLVAVVATVGIMADSAIAGPNRAVDMIHGRPFLPINMTGETEIFNPAGRDRHLGQTTLLLMTGTA